MTKIFISYSHADEDFLSNNLILMLKELQKENIVEYFYDRLLRPDGELFDTLDYHMKECDIAIVLLSTSYYKSEACKKEKEFLLNRKKLEGIYFLPIVVSSCNWREDESIKNSLFLNTDAKELKELEKSELEVEIEEIKKKVVEIAHDIDIIKSLRLKESFHIFLQDMDILKTSHRSKNELLLSDIFIYPTLRKFTLNEDDEIISDKIFDDSKDYKFVFISGDDLSGKSSLLKKYVETYHQKVFIPLIFIQADNFDGYIFNIIKKKFNEQFVTSLSDREINILLEKNKERIIILIDDFHKMKNPKKIIKKVNLFSKVILTTDLIYNLDYEIRDINDISKKYSIKELSPIQRNDLIKKWLYLDSEKLNELAMLKEIDEKTDQIEVVTGKTLNGGIMPAYPFLVLSILINVETLKRPLNQQITSYGYCYEALITIAFTKCGMKTDAEIGGGINFLSYFANELYKNEFFEMSSIDFDEFLEKYENKIALPFERDIFIKKLEESHLLIKSTLGNYRFDYKYIYYFFIAKYFAENMPDSLVEIENLCKRIHNDENAYTIIFFSHNTKSELFYEMLLKEADSIYSSVKSVSLSKKEMAFFKDSYQSLVELVLPNKSHNYKTVRSEVLKKKKEKEYSTLAKDEVTENNDAYILNLRKSIKLTEVIGLIAKNRYTSINKQKIRELLNSAIKLNFRELNSFFDLFKEPSNQKEIINFLADSVKKEIAKEKEVNDEKCLKIANELFWGMNFFYVYIIILKTIRSIGSEKLISFIKELMENEPTPANQLILEGVKIIYAKTVDKNNLFRHIKDSNYSDVAKTILRMLVVEYCRINPINFSEIQQLSAKMQIPISKLKK